MKKITELTEKRWRTKHYKDAYGNRIPEREEYITFRKVRSVKSGPRFGHSIVDSIIYRILIAIAGFVFTLISHNSNASFETQLTAALFGGIISMLLYPGYYFLFEFFLQRTPGKYLTKTLVINEYGQKPTIEQLLIRSVVRLVPFEPLSCWSDMYSRGWHDKWSNTWVVTEEELKKIKELQNEQPDLVGE